MAKRIVIGSRRSDLALWQTNRVIELLKAAHPDVEPEVQLMTTKGDVILDQSLPSLGGKGLFTEELERALRDGDIDLAVHSLKDLPTINPPGLVIGAVPERAPVADVLISRGNVPFADLPPGASIGTSSRRRAAQLLVKRPDLNMIDIRGNVPTRIEKAHAADGPYDAILLAQAGVERLELSQNITEVLPLAMMLPAPGQGALGIQCREDDTRDLLAPLIHMPTLLAVTVERAFLRTLEAGCSAPVAAYAYFEGETLHVSGRVIAVDGKLQIEVAASEPVATVDDAFALGARLADDAIGQGAGAILEAVR